MMKKSRPRFNSLKTEDSNMVGVPDIMKCVAEDGQLSADFLMPNGVMIIMKVNFYHSLDLLKQNVWKEAEGYPHFSLLKRSEFYNFVIITNSGEKEEVLDENQSLDDLRPFMPILKLVEKEGDEQEKALSHHIHTLIERGPGQKVEAWHSAEVSDFRTRMQQLCSNVNKERLGQNWLERLKYKHPPRLRSHPDLPADILQRLHNNRLAVDVRIHQTDSSYKELVDITATPRDLISQVLKEMRNNVEVDHYILKVGGLEEYLFGNEPLTQFEYVYKCIIQDVAPHFWLMHAEVVTDMAPPVVGRRRSISPGTQAETNRTTLVWDINERYYLKVSTINKLQFGDGKKVQLYMGVFHGWDALCSVKTTDDLTVQDGQVAVNKEFEFDISVADLPPMARLCFTLYLSGGGSKKGNRDLVNQAWVNIPIFDFRSRLMSGKRDLNMWQITRDLPTDERCYPIGCVTPNHLGLDSTVLSIILPEFDKFTVVYPTYDKVLECASQNMRESGSITKVSKSHLDQLQEIVSAGVETSQLAEQDKEILWLTRMDCREHYPDALPMLLKAVKWNNHADVCMTVALLQTWPTCPLEVALQLLDFDYPERNVRKLAVEWLDKSLTDEQLSLYMLQLVQALKYETHLYNPLVEFLLKRCLKNLHLGHQFFWLLKSEINNPVVSVQNGIILEVYLTSNRAHLSELVKQNEALRKLKALCAITMMQKIDNAKGEQAYADMRKVLQQKSFVDALSNLPCPLTPLYKLESLCVEQSRFMNSKKKPLWLEWKNTDAIGDNVLLLFKSGDDLRQDMLTLQMIQIMDSIWQAEGLDLRMNAYRCVATADEQGMIEVVTKATTIAKIMQNSVLDKKTLYEWLQGKNNTPEKQQRAVEEFMYSCAGYCVATYVLGIGDRHNDNIMLKENGQLFHIDFGHILGHFKSKLGIRRERVPFVLTTHFVYIMERGGKNNFRRFEEICEKAYVILRRKSTLFISLFRLMLQSGMPELTGQKDVDYLRQTLLPHLTEEEALKNFKSKLKDALKNSWTTMVNFKVHMMAKK